MRYLLDTNLRIYFLYKRSQVVIERLCGIPPQDPWLCSIVKAELWYGALKSGQPFKNFARLKEFFEGFLSGMFDDDAVEALGKFDLPWSAREHPSVPMICASPPPH